MSKASKTDDQSEDHLNWLLKSRADNMEASKQLFLQISTHMEDIAFSIELQEIAQDLAGVAFSLWRSVFLSDLNGDIAEQMADLKTFLGNLISNNTIAYPQDKNAKEFTFRYYLINAELRLAFIARKMPAILDRGALEKKGTDAKEAWTIAEEALTLAINNFGEILSLL